MLLDLTDGAANEWYCLAVTEALMLPLFYSVRYEYRSFLMIHSEAAQPCYNNTGYTDEET